MDILAGRRVPMLWHEQPFLYGGCSPAGDAGRVCGWAGDWFELQCCISQGAIASSFHCRGFTGCCLLLTGSRPESISRLTCSMLSNARCTT